MASMHSLESVTSHFMRMVMQNHCSFCAGEQKKPLERIEDSVRCEKQGQVYTESFLLVLF